MHRRQPLPRIWLMTDERQGDRLFGAVRALPGEAGIVFRHHSLAEPERRALFEAVRDLAPRTVILLASRPTLAAEWGAAGVHGWDGAPGMIRSVAVHDMDEMARANAAQADLAFVSPIFPTRSHPGAPTLGVQGLARITAAARMPVIALGGMTAARFDEVSDARVYGWAAIDALTPDQKRKAVPI